MNFKQRLQQNKIVLAPGVYDPLTALLVQQALQGITLRLQERPDVVMDAHLRTGTLPSATRQLPARSLGDTGGSRRKPATRAGGKARRGAASPATYRRSRRMPRR